MAVASWEHGTASSFVIEVAQDPDFSFASTTSAAQDLVVLSSLSPSTTYYLRVSAQNVDGVTSPPSGSVSFSTTAIGFSEPTPVLAVGSNTSTSLTPTWQPATAGLSYQVQVDTDSVFDNPLDETVAKPTATFEKLHTDTTYSVRVRAVASDGAAASDWSAVVSRNPAASQPLTVGSYNVLKAANKKSWVKRRGPVAKTILGEDPDVMGLQEATPVHVPGGLRQFQDVRRLLGSNWALTTSPGEAHIVYNTDRLTLISQGYDVLEGSNTRGVQRYAPWGVFEQKSTTKRFLFMNTHFLPQNGAHAKALRASAARQMVATINKVNVDNLPVVIVGDFNSGGNRDSSNAVYRTFTADYIDPLVNTGKLGDAEQRIRTYLKTVNKFKRTAPRDTTAPMIDQIFVSSMRVAEYEVVAKLDSAGRFVGTIPSDHNMIRATVYLP
jgi:endonuclease/exonuclease/phosphatase family metal-dependent hydrolase